MFTLLRMKNLATSTLFPVYCFCSTSVVHAHEWDASTKLTMAKCLVAEADFGSRTEKAAIAHVLLKRWEVLKRIKPGIGFKPVIRSYCSIFKLKKLNSKQQWIKSLKWGTLKKRPPFNTSLTLEDYNSRWEEVRSLVNAMEAEIVIDPLPSSIHWGNEQDHVNRVKKGLLGKVVLLPRVVMDPHTSDSVILENYFYRRPR